MTRDPSADAEDRILRGPAASRAVRLLLAQDEDLVLPRESHRALLEADALMEAARRDAAALLEQARQDGLARGLRQTLAVLGEAERQRAATLADAQEEIATLALAVARKLVVGWLEEDPARVVELVGQVLEAAGAARQIVIRVPLAAARPLEAERERLSRRVGGARLRVEGDPTLGSGDCVIDTEVGRIDARLDVQLEALRLALTPTESE
jgi:type III secretion protein L